MPHRIVREEYNKYGLLAQDSVRLNSRESSAYIDIDSSQEISGTKTFDKIIVVDTLTVPTTEPPVKQDGMIWIS